MGIEEGTCWDEHWVLYGNQFDNKFHIFKKKKKERKLSRDMEDTKKTQSKFLKIKPTTCEIKSTLDGINS